MFSAGKIAAGKGLRNAFLYKIYFGADEEIQFHTFDDIFFFYQIANLADINWLQLWSITT